MNRQQKEAAVADLKHMMAQSQATFLVNYKGLDVSSLQTLRRSLRSEGANFKVTKASLMRIAAKDLPGSDDFAQEFKEQVALVFVAKDVTVVAKQLVSFAKENEKLQVLSGFFESKRLSSQDLKALALLPSREVLVAQLLGTMQAPIATFVRQLNQMIARLLYVLKQIEEKQQN